MFSFCKMQATGNDFVIVDCFKNVFEYSFPILVTFLCDRHYGVGADGVIFVQESKIADFKMRIFNSDGSEAEMCGNGIRCFAKYVYESGLTEKEEFLVETLAGSKMVKLDIENKKVMNINCNMGSADMPNIHYMIEIEDKVYQISPVSMGNPHAVCFVKNVEAVDVPKVGSKIENYKYFPNKTNVEFVEIVDCNKIKVRVWERGVGETKSCGTGACASVAIARKEGLLSENVEVSLKGGRLQVSSDKDLENIMLCGEAELVFVGEIEEM